MNYEEMMVEKHTNDLMINLRLDFTQEARDYAINMKPPLNRYRVLHALLILYDQAKIERPFTLDKVKDIEDKISIERSEKIQEILGVIMRFSH